MTIRGVPLKPDEHTFAPKQENVIKIEADKH